MKPSQHPLLGIIFSGLLSFLILLASFDIFWVPQDDGIFAYLAEAVRTGAVYGVDVIDIHGGYHTFLNEFLFSVFGSDVVVLRYPLVLLGIVNAVLAAYFLRDRGFVLQISCALLVIALGFIQFANPAPSWYILSLALFIAFLIERYGITKKTLLFVGMAIGVAAMFRHPNAVFLLVGAISYLYMMTATAQTPHIRDTLFSKGQILLGILWLIVYSVIVFEPTGFVFLVVPAVLFLTVLLCKPAPFVVDLWVRVWWLLVGIVAAILPMIGYQIWHSNLFAWISHLFWSQSIAENMPNFATATFSSNLVVGWEYIFGGDLILGVLQIGYWLLILSAPFIVLVLWLRTTDRDLMLHPIVPLALLYAPVSFYYQIPFYLYASLGLTALALLILSSRIVPANLLSTVVIAVAFCAVLLTSPITYSLLGSGPLVQSTIPGVSLRLSQSMNEDYLAKLQPILDAELSDGELFAAPLNQDLYFTSNIASPTPVHWSLLLRKQYPTQELNLDWFESLSPPVRLFVFSMDSKYVSVFDEQLIAELENNPAYKELPTVGETRYFLLIEEQTQ